MAGARQRHGVGGFVAQFIAICEVPAHMRLSSNLTPRVFDSWVVWAPTLVPVAAPDLAQNEPWRAACGMRLEARRDAMGSKTK